ncbi:pentapeptide repeat-containing protein [Candidatus Sulfurimonas baltica]|uniref:Pentapeptide repeat-containing protein n=1 Tax=Candidatus Sulfurimonas baltica TaxID=2740404 RepID=A0A7S7LVX5_9BACT|nr:pentapeptide repeat-containing protein [Candidatus Sulfurimonas baltica]QOY52297.1 pentapeptide repeat-containing protein [Candidatus Sulfurimonas baltica]
MESKKYTCSICKDELDENNFDIEQNKCILHCEKTDKNGWYSINSHDKEWTEKLNTFWLYIQQQLDNIYQDNLLDYYDTTSEYQYTDVIFPKFEKEYEYNHYASNEPDMGTNFFSFGVFENQNEQPSQEVNQIFNKLSITFKGCTFLDEANFKKYYRKSPLTFNECKFEKTLLLGKTQKSQLSFYDCDFNNKDLDISESIFEDVLIMKNCKNINLFDISNSTLNGFSNFMNSNFIKADFTGTLFGDSVVFIETTFQQDIDFKYTTFNKLALFRDSVFSDTLNLRDTIFKDEVNFLGMKANMANRETARLIKSSFEQQKNLIESNKYHALELREKSKELSLLKNLPEWILFKAHWISSNHSQSYILALFWIIVISILGIENNVICSLFSFIYSDDKLNDIAMSIHSILSVKSDSFSMYQLFLKISMAYLVYQFLVSVRQNTRRK